VVFEVFLALYSGNIAVFGGENVSLRKRVVFTDRLPVKEDQELFLHGR
jgi:hypothetical protein